MLGNRGSNDEETQSRRPLIPEVTNGGEEGQEHTRTDTVHGWGSKILDLKEAKDQIVFVLPMILTNVSYFLVTLIAVMFAGQLGVLQLAGATLGNSWSTVTGAAVMIGLSGALETLCGQGFGAEQYAMLGIYVQACCIISLIFSTIIAVIWLFTKSIFILLHQSADISSTAAVYMRFSIPGLFAYGLIQNFVRFLQTQSVVMPLVVISSIPLFVHIGILYALVNSLGFKGAPIAVSITFWVAILLLALYVTKSRKFKDTWKGFSFQSFSYVLTVLKLALPSAGMVCLEYWVFEILVFLAGLLPDPEITTSLIAICVNTEALAYMISYSMSAAASTRVSNELGADNPDGAKHAMGVTLKLSIIPALCFVIALSFGHGLWVQLFNSSSVIRQEFASMTPLLVTSILLDTAQCVLSGVARGCGWQHLAVYVNLGTFYFIGLPISCILGFMTSLTVKGLWIGVICGLVCQVTAFIVLIKLGRWKKLSA
ncbi:protein DETOXIFICATION 18 [Neltuma alba]|uniref:protein DETOXIFICATION 18 n=1 Tax=Neltuma alba TaxID=207710 RepID=UPI0010A335A3|nr:protein DETOXIFICATION 18-like [Prosopis alba]